MTTNPSRAILAEIEGARRILVASHEGPDGDAVASTLALALALREQGRQVVAYNRDGCPAQFAFLPGAATIVNSLGEERFDLGLVLDAGELKRAGSELRDRCRVLVNIDHHPYSELFGEWQWIDEAASATGILVYRLLRQGGHPLSPDVAQCIYTAILSDTGSFRYSNANPEAFAVAGELVGCGVDTWRVASQLYESHPEARLHLLAEVLGTLAVSSCGRIASVACTLEMMSRTGTGPEHTDGFVNYPRAIAGVEVAIFLRQIAPGAFKAGFRSKGLVDVGALARALGGGGHHNAAGAVVEGSLAECRDSLLDRLSRLIP